MSYRNLEESWRRKETPSEASSNWRSKIRQNLGEGDGDSAYGTGHAAPNNEGSEKLDAGPKGKKTPAEEIDPPSKKENSADQVLHRSQANEEGRLLYVGNLSCEIQHQDVLGLFETDYEVYVVDLAILAVNHS